MSSEFTYANAKHLSAAKTFIADYHKANKTAYSMVRTFQEMYADFDPDAEHWFGAVGVSLTARGYLTVCMPDTNRSQHISARLKSRADVLADPRLEQWRETARRVRGEGSEASRKQVFGRYFRGLPGMSDVNTALVNTVRAVAYGYPVAELEDYLLKQGRALSDLAAAAGREDRAKLLSPGAGSAALALRRECALKRECAATLGGGREALDNATRCFRKLGLSDQEIRAEFEASLTPERAA